MIVLLLVPWAWFSFFVLLESNGFYRAHDRWPSFVEIVRWWEPHYSPEGWLNDWRWRGIVSWSWQRWLVAAALPLLGALLEASWLLGWL